MKLVFGFTGAYSKTATFLTLNKSCATNYHTLSSNYSATTFVFNNPNTFIFNQNPKFRQVRWSTNETDPTPEKVEKAEKGEKKKKEKKKDKEAASTGEIKPLWPPRTWETEKQKYPLLLTKTQKGRSEMTEHETVLLKEKHRQKSQTRVKEMVQRRDEADRAIEKERIEIEEAKWKLRSGTIIQRLPVISPPLPQWEQEFMSWKAEKQERIQLLIHENKKKVFPDLPPRKPFQEIEFPTEEHWYTEADEQENMKSLDRRLTRSLYLLVNKPADKYLPWQFPSALHLIGETMRKTAQRAIKFNMSSSLRIFYISNAPSVHVTVPFEPVDQQKNNVHGYKLFLFRAQLLKGDGIKEKKAREVRYYTPAERETHRQEEERIRLIETTPTDDADHITPKEYIWVTKEEMKDYFPAEVYDRLQHALVPDYDEYCYNF